MEIRAMRTERLGALILSCLLAGTLTIGRVPAARGDDAQDPRVEETPPRLSLTDGQGSVLPPGAQDWTAAQGNTPPAPGDRPSTGMPGTLELQIGGRAFVRAWGNTQISFGAQEPDFLQFTVAAGSAVFDLRSLDSGDTVQVDTPNASISIQQVGYYRIDVMGDRTQVMTRRGGRATVTPAGGPGPAATASAEPPHAGAATAPPAGQSAAPPAGRGPLDCPQDRP